MKRNIMKIILLSVLSFFAVAGSAHAAKGDARSQAEATSKAKTAAGLISAGLKNKDPYAILVGVRYLNQLGTPLLKPGSTKKGDVYDPENLLDQAKGFAGKNSHLVALLEEEKDNIVKSRGNCYYNYYYDWYGNLWYEYICD